MFEVVFYKLIRIDGDYGVLADETGSENTVALALLPFDINEGDIIKCENFTYEVVR